MCTANRLVPFRWRGTSGTASWSLGRPSRRSGPTLATVKISGHVPSDWPTLPFRPLSLPSATVRTPTEYRAAVVVLAALLALGQPTSAAAPARRFGSGPLTRSVQNEADAAIDRAQLWLLAEQAAGGSWGGSNLYLTAVCAIALSGDGVPAPAAHEAAVARALAWLRTAPAPASATPDGARTAAWRELALRHLDGAPRAPAAPIPEPPPAALSNLLVELVLHEVRALDGIPPPEPAPADSGHPVEDLLRAAQRGLPAPLLRRPLAAVAAAWSSPDLLFWRESQAQRAWWLARTLNRQAGGVLALAGGPALDWRRDLAGYWVNRQRIAPRGGGHWLSDAVSPVEETAFAILLLREL